MELNNDNDPNMNTKIWGPAMWISMHSISFCYPMNPSAKDKENYKNFFELIGELLPCIFCKKSYKKLISTGITKLDDNALQNRTTLTKWLYYVHEAVNEKLGVNYGVSYDDVVKRYEAYKVSCKNQMLEDKINESKGCESLINKKNKSFKIANNRDCPIIPIKMAKHFIKYAKMRGLDKNEFYMITDDTIKHDSRWDKRNKQCNEIINNMRENGIVSIEQNGEFRGLPTIEELKLILRLSSNLSNDKLIELIKNLPFCEYQKIYKLIK